MASTPSLGPPLPPSCSQRRLGHLFSRVSFWDCTHSTRAVPGAMERPPANYIRQLQSSTPLPTRPASYAEAAASVPDKLLRAEYTCMCGAAAWCHPGPPGPRAVQGAGGRKEVLHHQPRRQQRHGLCRPPQASPQRSCGSSTASGQRSSCTRLGRSGPARLAMGINELK